MRRWNLKIRGPSQPDLAEGSCSYTIDADPSSIIHPPITPHLAVIYTQDVVVERLDADAHAVHPG